MYCVKCKTSTDTLKPQYSITKNNKYIKKGQCKQCKSTKTSFVTQETAKKGGFLITIPTLLAGLAAAGSIAGGASAVANAVNKKKADVKLLEETMRHNTVMEKKKGAGVFLRPAPRGKGLFLKPYKK